MTCGLIAVPVSVAFSAAFAIGAWAGSMSPQASTTKRKSTATKSQPKAAAKKTVAVAAKSKRPPVAVHRAPQQPSTDRYKEIQQALADKGYFQGEPDGTWGAASIASLKRFQRDQHLVEDGKIGSLSLIALGLGPKREPSAEPEKTP